MIRKFAVAAAAGAIALSGLAAFGGGVASAKTIKITAGAGSHVHCELAASTAKVKPALKDNWIASDHQDDSVAAVRAIPNTPFADNGPVTVKSKPTTQSCTGTFTDGVNSATPVSAKISLASDPLHPGGTDPASCANLIAPTGPPSTARYNIKIKWTATGGKVADTLVTDAAITSGGSFSVGGGTISGSFAGGTSSTASNADAATVNLFLSSTQLQPKLVSSSQTNGGACQPSLQVKTTAKGTTAKLKKPKGIKTIGLAAGGDFDISR
jgi:hypothetical protein